MSMRMIDNLVREYALLKMLCAEDNMIAYVKALLEGGYKCPSVDKFIDECWRGGRRRGSRPEGWVERNTGILSICVVGPVMRTSVTGPSW